MIITAKFAGFCSCCNSTIAVGSKVEWTKGSKARHVACTGSVATAQARGPRRSALSRYRSGDASARSYGWDGVHGSASYYSSGQYDNDS